MKLKSVLKPGLAAVLGFCAVQHAHAVEIKYMLWDGNQKPAYEKCASDFQKENPGIQIKISQSAWPDYWKSLQGSLDSGQAPDVFTNHLSQYPGFVKKKQI
jgi:multiple sugar transport system substrate-binding protein